MNNREHKYLYDKNRRIKSPEIFTEYTRKFRENNPKKRYEYDKRILERSFKHRFYKLCLSSIKKTFKSGYCESKSKYLLFLNTDYNSLKIHLCKTIPLGYKWEDYINGNLQIDHIKPHSLFEYSSTNDEQFKECWSLDNLQLLTKEDNIKKQNKYEN